MTECYRQPNFYRHLSVLSVNRRFDLAHTVDRNRRSFDNAHKTSLDVIDVPLRREKTPVKRIKLASNMTANAAKVSCRPIMNSSSFCQRLVGIKFRHTPAQTTNAAMIIRT